MIPALLLLALAVPHDTDDSAGVAHEHSHEIEAQQDATDPRLDPDVPAQTANSDLPHGVLAFEIHDRVGNRIPGRLTFTRAGESNPDLFPGVEARPTNLAVRKNVVYCLSGADRITVPAGTYEVWATRGIEWSAAKSTIEIVAGETTTWPAELVQEVGTRGFISGDFHLHTLTHSGHGDSNMQERIISLIGEGVEFAVATDHNHNTDYGPTIDELQGWEHITGVVGNEVSTPIGHFNVFPLDPERAPVGASATDANELFQLLRAETSPFGVTPVIQLNHPRWEGIDYFTQTGLDPITGESTNPAYSSDFDTIELLNENEGWGFHDADITELETGSSVHSVLQDWYNLLNRGQKPFIVGNSDSHTVHHNFAGYPRNYVLSEARSTEPIDPVEIADSLRRGQVFTTNGPFVQFSVGDTTTSGVTGTDTGRVMVQVRVRTPSWIFVDRVKIVVDGDVRHEVLLEPLVDETGRVSWREVKQVLILGHDSWVHVIVEGDQPLDPIVTGGRRPILPLAITNPVWVDTDMDSQHRSLWSWALAECGTRSDIYGLWPQEAALVLLAAVERQAPDVENLLRSGFASRERRVRLAALRASEQLGSKALMPQVLTTFETAADPFLALTALRAVRACGDKAWSRRLVELFERFGAARLTPYVNELAALAPSTPVREWRVLGFFPSPEANALFADEWMAQRAAAADASLPGKGGDVQWRAPDVREDGYVDLAALDPEQASAAIAFARTWIEAPQAGPYAYAAGSDDGSRVWVNGTEVHTDKGQHAATPLQHVGVLDLQSGWNEVVIGVQNGGGPSGLYFALFDDALRTLSSKP